MDISNELKNSDGEEMNARDAVQSAWLLHPPNLVKDFPNKRQKSAGPHVFWMKKEWTQCVLNAESQDIQQIVDLHISSAKICSWSYALIVPLVFFLVPFLFIRADLVIFIQTYISFLFIWKHNLHSISTKSHLSNLDATVIIPQDVLSFLYIKKYIYECVYINKHSWNLRSETFYSE